jgi:hypothetical protein
MGTSRQQSHSSDQSIQELVELTKTLLIVQLGLAKVPQGNIQKIVGCNMNKVNAIIKLATPKKS